MPLEKIILFQPTISQHAVTQHFCESLYQAFVNKELVCSIVDTKNYPNLDSLSAFVENFSPDLTINFNGLEPQKDNTYLCDQWKIPHLSYLVDAPYRHFSTIYAQRHIPSNVDRYGSYILKLFGCKHSLFLPHACDVRQTAAPEEERVYDLSFVGKCFDPQAIVEQWQKNYPSAICDLLHRIVRETREVHFRSFLHLLLDAYQEKLINPRRHPYSEVATQLENYLRAVDRLELLRSLQGLNIHLFCPQESHSLWRHHLGSAAENITFHTEIPFNETVEIFKQSKIVLNSSPSFNDGTHERIFYGMAAGAAVVTNDSIYMRQYFDPGENVLLYGEEQPPLYERVLQLLNDDKARCSLARQGQELALTHHTWDNRAQAILDECPSILSEIHRVSQLPEKWELI